MAVVGNNIDYDTEMLDKFCTDVKDLLVEYEKNVNNFFNRLDFTSSDNKAWTGDNAKVYTGVVMQDKPDYINYGNSLADIVKDIEEFNSNFEDLVNKNEDSCKNDKDSFSNNYYGGARYEGFYFSDWY